MTAGVTADPLVRAARAIAVDRVTAEVITAMEAVGVFPILLKGPSLAQWLYPEGGRHYNDSDLLVAPDDQRVAARVLTDLGFTDYFGDASRFERSSHATVWVRRDAGGFLGCVDLHCGLALVPASPARQWSVLSEAPDHATVAGVSARVLGIPERAFHVALHLAQHGVSCGQPLEDLRRCLPRLDVEGWRSATRVAEALDAVPALSAGLRALPEGAAVAEALGLERRLSPRLRLSAGAQRSGGAVRLQELVDTGSWPARVGLAARTVLPTPALMRLSFPPADRGGAGWLTVAYVRRLALLAMRLGPAMVTWRQAQRAS